MPVFVTSSAIWRNNAPAIAVTESFAAQAQAFRNLLLQGGLVSVTPPINWSSSFLLPSTASLNTRRGLIETFRFNDSLQSQYPIFVRVEYGATVGSAAGRSTFSLFVATSTEIDVSGNLIGQTVSREFSFGAGDSALPCGSVAPAFVSYDEGRISAWQNVLTASVGTEGPFLGLIIERARFSNGLFASGGFNFIGIGGGSMTGFSDGVWSQFIPHNRPAPPAHNGGLYHIAIPTNPTLFNSDVAIAPVHTIFNTFMPPVTSIAICATADFSHGVLNNFSVYPTLPDAAYFPIIAPQFGVNTRPISFPNSNAAVRFMVRYD